MDASLKAELDAAADAAMSEYQTDESRERALRLKNVLTDGVCRIVDVQDQLHPPCVGLIHTDLGERFPVFDIGAREAAKSNIGKRVKLGMQMSGRGTRYVVGMARLPEDTSTIEWPCLNCWQALARPTPDGRYYKCTRCAYQMEVGP